MYIETGNRKIMVKVQHCGVDMKFMKEMIETEAFKKEYERMKEQYKGKYVLGSTDRLSPLSGVAEKLSGYKKLLEKFPDRKKNAVLIQVCSNLLRRIIMHSQ